MNYFQRHFFKKYIKNIKENIAMGIIYWIRKKIALMRAKKEEKKHILTMDELKKIEKEIAEEKKKLKKDISKLTKGSQA